MRAANEDLGLTGFTDLSRPNVGAGFGIVTHEDERTIGGPRVDRVKHTHVSGAELIDQLLGPTAVGSLGDEPSQAPADRGICDL